MTSNRIDYSQPMRSRNGSVSFSIGIHPLDNTGDPSYLGFSRLLRNELSYSDTQLAMKRRDELEMKRLLGAEVEEEHMGIPETASLRSLARRSLNRADNVDEGEEDAFNEMEVDVTAKKRRRRHRRRSGSFTGGANPRKYRNLVGYAIPYPNAHNNDWRDMLIITEYQEDTEVRHSDTETMRLEAIKRSSDKSSSIPRNSSEGYLHPRDLSYPQKSPPPLFHQMKFTSSNLSLNRNQWIQDTFYRRECSRFVPTNRDPEKCGCGRARSAHIDIPTLTENLLISQGSEMIEKKRKNTQDEDSGGIKIRPRRTNRNVTEKWSLRKHTILLPTDAFGQIEFQGGPHPYKAQYVRLSFDTDPAHIMSLFEHVWQIAPPKLIITVHGGTGQFDLQAKLARVFRKGLLKAALTTGAWIFTSGVDSGVVKHVAAAWEGAGSSSRSKVVCIGILPWGILKKRDELIGADKVVPYYSNSGNKTRLNALNNRHSYFLLVDNGTVGRYGGEVILRKRLETYIAQKQKIFGGTRSVPVVSVVLEGGSCTIRAVLDYVTNVPRVPVVICDGSGRAADMLAFAHQTVLEDGTLPDGVRPQLKQLVEKVFNCPSPSADRIVSELVMCAHQKHLMTIFRLGERHDVDHAILTALLKGQNLSPFDQLSLALAWNRVDIARSDIFAQPYDWPQSALYNAMMEALIHDRVDFVRLLLENGVSMQHFLTIGRLEELYNTDKGPPNTLYYIVRDVVKIKAGYQYRLPHIGMVIEKLMGNAYKSSYTSRDFRQQYSAFNKKYKSRAKMAKSALASAASRSRGGSVLSRQATEPILGHFTASMNDTHALSENMMAAPSGNRALSNHILWRSAFRRDNPINPLQMQPPQLTDSRDFDEEIEEEPSVSNADGATSREFEFRYPYSELLIWAVLTKRQEMALCMWQHGEEAMAKALIACRLYKSLATEAAEDYLEVEICDELKKYSEDFRMLSMELLEHCYQQDDTQTLQLLTYELSNWGRQTCLSLAVVVNNKQFLAHPCCQILLADLWHGGLRIRSHSNMKVIMGLICFPFILSLEFKSREELMNQPQRAAEHEHDIAETSSSSSSSSSSSDDSSSDSSDFEDDEDKIDTDKEIQHKKSRKMSHGSVQSLNLATIFQSRHRRRPKDRMETRDTDISCNEARVENGDALSYGTFVGHVGTVSPPSFVRKRLQSWKDPISRAAKSDVSTKTSIAGSKTTIVENGKMSVAVTKESGIPEKLNRFTFGTTIPRMRQIKLKRKFYEFFAAPITTFWGWCISFMIFMCTFTVVLLIRTPLNAAPVEWFLFFYVFAFGCEYFRKFIMSEMEPLSQKIRYLFSNFWNTVTIAAIVLFFIGFAMRLCRSLQIRSYGRVILACDSVLWAMKMLDYASVHPKLGIYITMAGKMIQNMVYIIIMLMVALLGFGLARQSITYPNEDFHWLLVRNIFYKPYFMLYGEVYADEIDTCGDEAWDAHFEDGTPLSLSTNGTMRSTCVPGHWIPPILTTIFLLIANILLMSMLIAIFNHIFDSTTEYSQQIWLFERYRQVMEYESTPVLPPPFTPISHLAMLIQYIRWRCCCVPKEEPDSNAKKRHVFDYSLKLFLSPDQVEKLHDFEEDCMDDLSREKEHKQRTSNEERIYRTAERTETILSRVMELQSKETTGRETLVEMDTRLQTVEKYQLEMLELMKILASQAMRGASPEQDIGINLEVIVDSPEEEEEEDKTEGLAPLPLRKRLRTNTICGADRQTRESTDEGGLTSPLPGTFRTRFSSMASLDASARQLHRHSKRRRHDAYTSITDGIVFDRERRPFVRCHSNIEAPDSPNLSDLPHSGDETQMKKPSLAEKRQLSDVVEALQKKDEEEDLADCELTMSEMDETMTNVDPIERRSTVGSKDGIMFEVVDEEQRVPPASPQRVDSPHHPL